MSDLPSSRSGPVTVLIVDDNDLIRSMCEMVLGRHGYVTVTATSTDDAFGRLAEHPEVAVVLSDLSMPGGRGGAALIDELRTTRPDLGLVVMTGNPDPSTIVPPVRLLSKPFTIDELASVVAAVTPDG